MVQANFRFSITALNSGEHNELLFVLSRYEMDLHSMNENPRNCVDFVDFFNIHEI